MSVPQLGQAGRTCVACRYFDARGTCRFTAPTVVGWPETQPSEWCGEWTVAREEMQAGEQREGKNFPTLSAVDDVPRFARGRR